MKLGESSFTFYFLFVCTFHILHFPPEECYLVPISYMYEMPAGMNHAIMPHGGLFRVAIMFNR